MKTLTTLSKSVLVALLCIAASFSGKSQTTVSINYGYDSSWTGYCQVPLHVIYGGNGVTTGYNYLTDDMDIHIYWGDGTDTLFSTPLYNNMLNDYFYFNAGHNYYSPGAFTVTIVATGVDGNDDTLTYGPILISSSCGTVDGYVYLDNNSNCTLDAGDDPLTYTPVFVTNPANGSVVNITYSDGTGYYSVTVPTGYSLNIAPQYFSALGYSVTCPAAGSYTFTSSGYNAYNFGLECGTTQFDAQVDLSGWGFIPGDTGYVYVVGWNASCMPVSGTMTLTLDPQVTYINNVWGTPPSLVAGNTITWNYTNLSYLTGSSWWNGLWSDLQIVTSTSATIGDTLCFTLTITPTAGDANPANNTVTYCYAVATSWDPNMKEVVPAGEGVTGNVAPNTEFTYTIHFQNTGTAPAQNIYVMDTISSNLDMTTFELLGASHSMTPYLYNGNILKFDFPGINLPDSVSNEPLSHGWIRYKIQAKTGLPDNTPITNTAHIFFDYNPAVVTNTTLNTIDIELGIEENELTANSIYPNPASNLVSLAFESPVSGNLQVLDATGKVVYVLQLNQRNRVEIEVANWTPGLYEVVCSGHELHTSRFMIAR